LFGISIPRRLSRRRVSDSDRDAALSKTTSKRRGSSMKSERV
jgi:hypothetical protein